MAYQMYSTFSHRTFTLIFGLLLLGNVGRSQNAQPRCSDFPNNGRDICKITCDASAPLPIMMLVVFTGFCVDMFPMPPQCACTFDPFNPSAVTVVQMGAGK